MLGQLFVRECRQTAKSLIYWLIVLILIFDFTTQLGEMEIDEEPQPGQEKPVRVWNRQGGSNCAGME